MMRLSGGLLAVTNVRWHATLFLCALLCLGLTASAGSAEEVPGSEAPEATAPDFASLAWLEEVAPLLSEEERAVFLALRESYQREGFIERFWAARDPTPRTDRNEFRETWRERVAFARSEFGDLVEDERSPALLLGGEPRWRQISPCPTLFRRDLEMWLYWESDQVDRIHGVVFHQPGSGPFREWQPDDPVDLLIRQPLMDLERECHLTAQRQRELRDPGSTSVDPRFLEIPGAQEMLRTEPVLACVLERAASACPEDERLQVATTLLTARRGGLFMTSLTAQGGRPMAHMTRERRLARPEPRSAEWLRDFQGVGTSIPEGAETFPIDLEVNFGRGDGLTLLRGVATVRTEAVAVGEIDGRRSRSFQVDGEVIRKGRLLEGFRYRFDVPEGDGIEAVPLVFDRRLRPGPVQLRVRVQDLHGGGFGRIVRDLEVPRIDRELPVEMSGEWTVGLEAPPLRLVEPRGEVHVGMQRFETELGPGSAVDRVEFFLDGSSVLVRKRPPYTVELDLGPVPRLHRVRAVARDSEGRHLGSDEVELNLGPHRFGVRLQEPQRSADGTSVSIRAAVDLPEGDSLDRLEILVDGERRSVLVREPFTVTLPTFEGLARIVEARGFSTGGLVAEDVAVLGDAFLGERIDVRLVEVWASVIDRQRRPVQGLSREELVVREDDVPQELVRFEEADDLPLHAALVLDTSTSMEERLSEVRDGVVSFLGGVPGKKDRVALVTFSNRPDLAIELTRDLDPFRERVATLKAEGSTALWDAVVFALRYFNGVQGQRVILLLTDGDDDSSAHSFADVRLHAETAGVAVYPIGLSIPRSELEIRFRLGKLAEVTGGREFYVERADELPEIYAAIEAEVRSKLLLAYQSEGTGRGFRVVEVTTTRPGVVVEAMSGYFP